MTTSMNISLPESLKEYVRQRVVEGSYANPSDYVRALIRADKEHQAQAKLEQRLLEGVESGEPIEVDEEYWKKKRAQLLGRRQTAETK